VTYLILNFYVFKVKLLSENADSCFNTADYHSGSIHWGSSYHDLSFPVSSQAYTIHTVK